MEENCNLQDATDPVATRTEPLPVEPLPRKTRGEKARETLRRHLTAPRIAYMALFTALAYVVTFLEFPIFNVPYANQLKFDFANVFFMIEGFIFGPVEAVLSIAVKELLCFADSSTMGVGEVANFIMSTAYILVPSVGYRFLKGRKWVALFLAIACVVQIGISFIVNCYINFPFFGVLFHFDGTQAFWTVWYLVIAFNAIKSVGISVVVILLYKPLSRFIKATSDKFNKSVEKVRRKRMEERARKKAEKQP